MKKTFSALVILSFLAVLVVPIIASAEDAPKDCCMLSRGIELSGIDCDAGEIAAPSQAAANACDSNITSSSGDTTKFCSASENNWGMFCLLNTLYGVTDWIFVALVAVAGIMVIMGAFTLLMSQGDPEKVGNGRNYIIYAAVGLAVGLLARAIPNIVSVIVGA